MRHETDGSAGGRNILPGAAPDPVERLGVGRTRLERIIETPRTIAAGGLDLDAIARIACDQAQALTAAGGAAVLLAEHGDSLRCAAATGADVDAPRLISRWQTDMRIDDKTARRLGIASGLAAPLRHEAVTFGVVLVHSAHPDAFTDDDARRLNALSRLVSAAMGSAGAFEARRAEVETHHDELSSVDWPKQFQTIFDGAPIGLVWLERERDVVAVNAAFERMVGYTAAELAGDGISRVFAPADVEHARRQFTELREGVRDAYECERRYIRKDGEPMWCHVSVAALERDTGGQPRYVIMMAEDITKWKLAELALRKKTDRLARIVETQRAVASADLDLAGVMDLICERTQELTGGDGASILIVEGDGYVYRAASGSLTEHVGLRTSFEGTFPGWVRTHGRSAVGHDSLDDERFSRRAATIGIRSAVAVPLHHGESDVGQLHVVSRRPHAFTEDDVQTLDLLSVVLSAALSHAAEFEAVGLVRQTADRLARIVEAQHAIAEAGLDLEAVMDLIVERACALTRADGAAVNLVEGDEIVTLATTGSTMKMLGFRRPLRESITSHAAKLGGPLLIEHAEDDPRLSDAARERTGERSHISVPLFKEGKVVASLTVIGTSEANRLQEDDRRTLELLAVVLGAAVSAAAEFEAKRKQVEALSQLDVVWKNSPIGIQLVSLDGHVLSANPAMLEIYGWSLEELAARHMSEYLHPDDIDGVVGHVEKLAAGGYEGDTCKLNARFVRKDGTPVSTMSSVSLVRDPDGKPLFFVGMVEDVTGQKAAEEQLRQSQKIEAIGQLSAGIAHDFNNLLMGVLGYAGLARAEAGSGTPLAAYLERIEETGHRAASLTKQLLAFGRRQTLQPRELDVNELVSDTLSMLRRVLGEHIQITSNLHPSLPLLRADPTQIQQVLLNLALNARDAMPDGGVLTIETWMTSIGENAGSRLELEPGRYVVISVADTGGGMVPEVVERIFEPFFTTKEIGEGSGLGLSSVHGIVKQSHGDLEVESRVGSGTAFRIYLPAVEAASQTPAEPHELAAAG